MFKGPKRVVYRVSDLEKAKEWYAKALGRGPAFDSPMGVVFAVDTSILMLEPRAGSGEPKGEDGPVVYWAVDDATVSFRALCEAGATPHAEPASIAGNRWGTVKDPFGNVIGVTSAVTASEKTVAAKPSDTALGVANIRFLATLDERVEIRGPDYLAEAFVPDEVKASLREPQKRQWFVTRFLPPGTYLGHVARTVWFDGLVKDALVESMPQIVFLGAGYDSRAYRFAGLNRATRIFEVDAAPTQERKKEILGKAGIEIPDLVRFVPIDFNKDTLRTPLVAAGFDTTRKSLFVWEGVTYYLPPEAIDLTLRFIRENSPPGSSVCFDYHVTFPGMEEAYGVKEEREFMAAHAAGERMRFAVERDRIGSFLDERGFALAEHLSPEEMEKKYLILKDGTSAGRTNGIVCYARATVA